MRPNRSLCITAACLAVWAWHGRALACSVIWPQLETVSCGAAADGGVVHPTSAASAQLQIEAVQVQRSRYAPPGLGDCGELGSTNVSFRLAGNPEWPSDMGVLVSLRQGNFIYFQPPLTSFPAASGWLFLPQTQPPTGRVHFFGPDDPHQPLELLLDVRAVDCNGNLSAPVALHISDPGRQSDPRQSDPRQSDPPNGPPGDAGATGSSPPAPTGDGGSATLASSPSPGEAPAARPAPSSAACSTVRQRRAPVLPGALGLSLGVLLLLARSRRPGSSEPVM